MIHCEDAFKNHLFSTLNGTTQTFLQEKFLHYGFNILEIEHMIMIAAEMQLWGYCIEHFWVDKKTKVESLILLECHYSTLMTIHKMKQ